MPKKNINREYKDTVFNLIFGEHKEYAMALYNAVNGTDYTDVENLQIVTLKDALYIGRKDDAAYIFHDILSMFEQQSTYNPNMPFRGLGYFNDSYNEYVSETYGKRILYSSKLIHIPCPRFYVLYNGTQEQPESQDLRLSDAYDGDGDVEVVAHMLNINKGHNEELMKACKPLREYAELVDRVRTFKAQGLTDEEAIEQAINRCIDERILVDILGKERARVTNILYAGLTEEEEKLFYQEEKERDIKEAVDAARAEEREKASRALADAEEKVSRALADAEEKATKADAKYSALNLKLLELGKYDELKRAASDKEYRQSLYELYGI